MEFLKGYSDGLLNKESSFNSGNEDLTKYENGKNIGFFVRSESLNGVEGYNEPIDFYSENIVKGWDVEAGKIQLDKFTKKRDSRIEILTNEIKWLKSITQSIIDPGTINAMIAFIEKGLNS